MPGKVNENQIYRWEGGKHQPNPDTLQALAKVLERDVAYFMMAGPEKPRGPTPDPLPAGSPDADQLALIQERIEDLSEICGRILTLLEQDLTDRATAAARQALATEQKRARAAHRTRAA